MAYYWPYRKLNEFKNYAINAKNIFARKENCNSKKNTYEGNKLKNTTKTKTTAKSTTAQYLYVDPKFLAHTCKDSDIKRIKGGQIEQEIYYDCQAYEENDDIEYQTKSQQQYQNMHMEDVMREMKNPKEFKRALKQLAITTNIVYRSFREAYSKAKRTQKNDNRSYCLGCEYCGGEESFQQFLCQMDRGDMNPLEVRNVEVPSKKLDSLKYETNEAIKKLKHKKNKSASSSVLATSAKDANQACLLCGSKYNNFDTGNQQTCVICKGPLENSFPKPEQFQIKSEIKSEPKWLPPTPPCLQQTYMCQQQEDELKGLDFCNRCAVLRGEMPAPNKNAQKGINEKSSESCQSMSAPNRNGRKDDVEKSSQTYQSNKQGNKSVNTDMQTSNEPSQQMFNLSPIYVTIPLKLQIDSQECQSRFMETEIIMETTNVEQQHNLKVQKLEPMIVEQPLFKTILQSETDSVVFQSCYSHSSIIEPIQTTIGNTFLADPIITDIELKPPLTQQIVDFTPEIQFKTQQPLIKTTQVIIPEPGLAPAPAPTPSLLLDIKPPQQPQQIVELKQLITKGTQSSTIIPTMVPPPAVVTSKSSRTEFVQTLVEQTTSKDTQVTKPLTRMEELQMKYQRLRGELVKEVRTALDQNAPAAAIQILRDGKSFPMAPERSTQEQINFQPSRFSLSTDYQNSKLEPILQFSPPSPPPYPSTGLFPLIYTIKPPIAAEPLQTIAAGSVRKDLSTSGHFRRNEMREDIEKLLKELIHPHSSKAQQKYDEKEREQILVDLHKVLHRDKTDLSTELIQEIVLHDIRYILGPDKYASTSAHALRVSQSQESVLENVKHILQPKSGHKKKSSKKFSKDTKEKILEDLCKVLTPRKMKGASEHQIRERVLCELRFMLNTAEETTSSNRTPRQTQQQQDPNTSHQTEIKPNQVRDSRIADLRYMVDSTSNRQQQQSDARNNAPPTPPPKPARLIRAISRNSSEDSVIEQNKTRQ